MNQFSTQKYSRVLFWSLLGLLLGLCFTRYALQVNISLTILLVVAVLVALLGDRDEIIALCICMIPLDTSIQYTYVLMFCMLLYLVKFSQSVYFNLSIVPVLLMILWELLHCFGGSFSPVSFLGSCMPQLLLAVLMCAGDKRFDYDFIVRAFSVSVAVMCFCLLGRVLYVANFNLLEALNGLRRLGLDAETVSGLEITGGQQNPNTLGIQCVLAITGLIQMRRCRRNGRLDMGLILFLLVFGTLTSSRTYLACLAIMGMLFVCGQKGKLSEKLKFCCGILLVILVVLLFLHMCFPELLEYYYGRFFMDDITTGRSDLMSKYHQLIMSDKEILFFGIGNYDFGRKVLEGYRVASVVPHNGIQELIIAWGIPGVLLFLFLWTTMLLRSRQVNRKQSLIHFIPLLVLLVKVQVGQMLTSAYTMMAFSYAYLSLCADLTPKAEDRILTRNQADSCGSG